MIIIEFTKWRPFANLTLQYNPGGGDFHVLRFGVSTCVGEIKKAIVLIVISLVDKLEDHFLFGLIEQTWFVILFVLGNSSSLTTSKITFVTFEPYLKLEYSLGTINILRKYVIWLLLTTYLHWHVTWQHLKSHLYHT